VLEEFLKLVNVDFFHKIEIRKVIALGPFCDASLQSTLNRISSKVVGTVVTAALQKRLCINKSRLSKPLKILPIHQVSRSG